MSLLRADGADDRSDGIDPRPLDVDNWTFFVGPSGFAYRPVGGTGLPEKRHLGGGLFKQA